LQPFPENVFSSLAGSWISSFMGATPDPFISRP
jgi:hypothetical protein